MEECQFFCARTELEFEEECDGDAGVDFGVEQRVLRDGVWPHRFLCSRLVLLEFKFMKFQQVDCKYDDRSREWKQVEDGGIKCLTCSGSLLCVEDLSLLLAGTEQKHVLRERAEVDWRNDAAHALAEQVRRPLQRVAQRPRLEVVILPLVLVYSELKCDGIGISTTLPCFKRLQ